MGKYINPTPKVLSPEDKEFIKRTSEGEKKAPAFRASYPNHPAVLEWTEAAPGSDVRKKAAEKVVQAAKFKLQAQYMTSAITTYQDKMEEFSEASIDTAIELVKGARSEKVRADLAIEGMRHQVGTPVQKIAIQEKKTVFLTFGEPPEDARDITDIPEADVTGSATSSEQSDYE